MTQSEFTFNEELIQEQRAVVKFEIEGEDWYMDYDEWVKAEEEGRNRPVIFKDKLLLVDDDMYNDLEKLMMWIKYGKE
jgi:hypothetical protein